jgi:bacteriocin biosynthesis cyclodehydratase domain-containing protein
MTDLYESAESASVAGTDRPVLKPWLTWTVTDERLVVSSGAGVTVFEGAASRTLLPSVLALLDGSLTVDEIVASLGETIRPAIEQAISEVASRDLLFYAAPNGDSQVSETYLQGSAAAIAADRLDATPADVAERLLAQRATVAGSGPIAGEIVRLLRLFGVGSVELTSTPRTDDDGDLTIVVVNPGDDSAAAAWNLHALAADTPWLPVMAYDGRLATVGPLITPNETACFECLRIRRASNLSFRVEQRIVDEARDRDPNASRGGVVGGPLAHLAATLAADAAIGMLLAKNGEPSMLAGRVVTVAPSMGGPLVETHRLYRVPRCPACSRARGLGHPQVWFEPEADHDVVAQEVVEHVCSSCGG